MSPADEEAVKWTLSKLAAVRKSLQQNLKAAHTCSPGILGDREDGHERCKAAQPNYGVPSQGYASKVAGSPHGLPQVAGTDAKPISQAKAKAVDAASNPAVMPATAPSAASAPEQGEAAEKFQGSLNYDCNFMVHDVGNRALVMLFQGGECAPKYTELTQGILRQYAERSLPRNQIGIWENREDISTGFDITNYIGRELQFKFLETDTSVKVAVSNKVTEKYSTLGYLSMNVSRTAGDTTLYSAQYCFRTDYGRPEIFSFGQINVKHIVAVCLSGAGPLFWGNDYVRGIAASGVRIPIEYTDKPDRTIFRGTSENGQSIGFTLELLEQSFERACANQNKCDPQSQTSFTGYPIATNSPIGFIDSTRDGPAAPVPTVPCTITWNGGADSTAAREYALSVIKYAVLMTNMSYTPVKDVSFYVHANDYDAPPPSTTCFAPILTGELGLCPYEVRAAPSTVSVSQYLYGLDATLPTVNSLSYRVDCQNAPVAESRGCPEWVKYIADGLSLGEPLIGLVVAESVAGPVGWVAGLFTGAVGLVVDIICK
jgi:hypothetical protein